MKKICCAIHTKSLGHSSSYKDKSLNKSHEETMKKDTTLINNQKVWVGKEYTDLVHQYDFRIQRYKSFHLIQDNYANMDKFMKGYFSFLYWYITKHCCASCSHMVCLNCIKNENYLLKIAT